MDFVKILTWVTRMVPALAPPINRVITHRLASATSPRPHRLSLWSGGAPATGALPNPLTAIDSYASWPGLVDRDFTGRHLPPADHAVIAALPPMADTRALFQRGPVMKPNPQSNVLFCVFAQWFTDSFLRTDHTDRRRTTSNHEINLCQIYGLDEASTRALRSMQGGRLKSRMVDGAEYPALLYANGALDPTFFDSTPNSGIGLSYLRGGRAPIWETSLHGSVAAAIDDPNRRDYLYAAGLDRGSSTVAYSAFNTIFLREHNRIAGLLAAGYTDWDDERLFQTARLISIRQVLTVVVNDYIRHIAGGFPFSLDRSFAEGKRWYRANRITVEFNLLYRWHALVPDYFALDGEKLPPNDYRYNNQLLERFGVEQVLSDLANQPAGRVCLFNSPDFLVPAEGGSINFGREFHLASFNKYRKQFGLRPYASIAELADGPDVAAALTALYGNDVNAVEFIVGLFAEQRGPSAAMPETLVRMVAYDAFTHILTNPVLAANVHCRATFSDIGWDIVRSDSTLAEIVARNTDPAKPTRVSFDHRH